MVLNLEATLVEDVTQSVVSGQEGSETSLNTWVNINTDHEALCQLCGGIFPNLNPNLLFSQWKLRLACETTSLPKGCALRLPFHPVYQSKGLFRSHANVWHVSKREGLPQWTRVCLKQALGVK